VPNDIKVQVAAKESGLAKIQADAEKAGRKVADGLQGGFDKAGRAADDAGKKIDKSFESALNSVRSELDQMERNARQAADGMDEAFTTAVRSMRTELDRLEREGDKTGAGLESALGGALRDVRADAQRLSSEMDDVGSDWGSALSDGLSGGLDVGGLLDSLGGGLGPAAGAAMGLGTAIGAAIWSGAESVWEEHEVGGLIAAQNRGTIAQARRLGDVAGDAFYDGFGESIQDVGAALNAVVGTGLADMDAPAAELDRLTKMAVTASTVVGEEASEIARAAQQLLSTGLAGNAEEAIDIIVAAAQNGMNISGDLLDTITEYGTQFRTLGLEASQGLGLVSQAMKAGARDSDIAADALKEFAIRAQDGSALTASGFRTLGMDAKLMADAIGSGGDRAAGALDATLDALREIEDPVLRNQTAVALFGTQAEDLGDALFAMDLDTVAEQMGNMKGATDDARAAIEATTAPMERLGRGFGEFMDWSFEGIKLGDLDIFGGSSIQQMEEGVDIVGKYRDILQDWLPKASGSARAGLAVFEDGLDTTNESGLAVVRTLDEIIAGQREMAGGVLNLSEAQINWHAAIDEVDAALARNGETLDLNTEKGRDNQSTLNDLADAAISTAEAMIAQGYSAEEVAGYMEGARREFVRSADQLGATGRQANRAADALGLIPGDYRANVHANTSGAMTSLNRIGSALNFLDGRQATVRVSAVGSALGLRTGGIVGSGLGFEHGGIVGGGMPWGAASGGQRHSSTVINEAGPEVVELPSGSRVATAGATRALAESGAFSGGGGWSGPVVAQLELTGNTDGVMATAIAELFRRKALRLVVDRRGQVVPG
jgi:phage-related minor tail protein